MLFTFLLFTCVLSHTIDYSPLEIMKCNKEERPRNVSVVFFDTVKNDGSLKRLLRYLEDYDATGTLFVTYDVVIKNNGLIQRAIKKGYGIVCDRYLPKVKECNRRIEELYYHMGLKNDMKDVLLRDYTKHKIISVIDEKYDLRYLEEGDIIIINYRASVLKHIMYKLRQSNYITVPLLKL